MNKYFVVSDVHGFYDIMIEALEKAGFDKNNPNHYLISCGDNFDRGDQPNEILKYLLSLERVILIRGNHEDLIEECVERGYPEWHDSSNGTMKTIATLGGLKNHHTFELACITAEARLKPLLEKMVNYFETENYVFVHSFIPYELGKEWREATNKEWSRARWGDPFALCAKNLWKENKTLVFGHWHTSKMWSKDLGLPQHDKDESKFDIYYGKNYIGLDACTVISEQVNVLILEDEECSG